MNGAQLGEFLKWLSRPLSAGLAGRQRVL